jgi:hypothetical protein
MLWLFGIDLASPRGIWADYFDSQGLRYAFYSATNATARQEALREALISGEPMTVINEVAEENEELHLQKRTGMWAQRRAHLIRIRPQLGRMNLESQMKMKMRTPTLATLMTTEIPAQKYSPFSNWRISSLHLLRTCPVSFCQ